MRLTLDVTAVPASPGGAGRYTIELAAALARRPDVALTAVSRRGDGRRWSAPGSGSPVVPAVVEGAPAPRPLRLAWEQLGLPRLLGELDPDVHHGPHYTMPERAGRPVVVTVHDCTFFDHPEWHERAKALLFRRAIRTAARRAAAIVCVSNTTATRLAAVCDVRVPVVVAPHGVDHRRFAPVELATGGDAAHLRALGLDPRRPYVCFVGTLEPRKDVGTLIRAFDRLAAGRPELDLVLAGGDGWGDNGVAEALAAARHAERVRRLGYVADEAVPSLLRQAAAVAYPSLEEGYGLPALEALACGAPLVTTSGTAMAELAGDAALLVRPADAAHLAEGLEALLDGGGTAGARRVTGLRIAAGRTWDESARRHLVAYRLAAAQGAGGRP